MCKTRVCLTSIMVNGVAILISGIKPAMTMFATSHGQSFGKREASGSNLEHCLRRNISIRIGVLV